MTDPRATQTSSNERTAQSLHGLAPSALEWVAYTVPTGLVLLFGNLTFFSSRLGLSDGQFYLRHTTGSTVQHTLGTLDTLSFTPRLVTFLFWLTVGLLVFSIVHTLSASYTTFRQDVEISRDFIHPQNFSGRHFWYSLLLLLVVRVAVVFATVISCLLALHFLIPLALALERVFFNERNYLANVQYIALAFGLTYLVIAWLALSFKTAWRSLKQPA